MKKVLITSILSVFLLVGAGVYLTANEPVTKASDPKKACTETCAKSAEKAEGCASKESAEGKAGCSKSEGEAKAGCGSAEKTTTGAKQGCSKSCGKATGTATGTTGGTTQRP